MAETRIEVERADGFLYTPDCAKKTTDKKYKGQHAPERRKIIQGRGAKSNVIICWHCANLKQKAAIRRQNGGPR